MLIEQAVCLATTGRERVLDVTPTGLHQRIGFVFVCADEVERITLYHTDRWTRCSHNATRLDDSRRWKFYYDNPIGVGGTRRRWAVAGASGSSRPPPATPGATSPTSWTAFT